MNSRGALTAKFIFLGILLPVAGFAAEAHTDHGIPWKLILFQCFNFFAAVGILVYLLRDKLKIHFAERRRDFLTEMKMAEMEKTEAETNLALVESRLQKLRSTEEEQIKKTLEEARAMKDTMVKEAQNTASRIEADTERLIQLELDKSQKRLRDELLENSFSSARQTLKSAVKDADQTRLQSEFVRKIEAVK